MSKGNKKSQQQINKSNKNKKYRKTQKLLKLQDFNWVHHWPMGDQYSDKVSATDNYNMVWDFQKHSIFSTTILNKTISSKLTPKTLCYRVNKQHDLMIAWTELDVQ